jgi:hypothetical protein
MESGGRNLSTITQICFRLKTSNEFQWLFLMTNSEKIKELHQTSKLLLDEYRIIAREITHYLRTGIPVEQEMIRLQNAKQQQLERTMSECKELLAKVTAKKMKFTDPFKG